MFSILLDIHLGVELLGRLVTWCLNFWGTARLISKESAPFHIPTSNVSPAERRCPANVSRQLEKTVPSGVAYKWSQVDCIPAQHFISWKHVSRHIGGHGPAFKSLILRICRALQSPECSHAGSPVWAEILFLLVLLIMVCCTFQYHLTGVLFYNYNHNYLEIILYLNGCTLPVNPFLLWRGHSCSSTTIHLSVAATHLLVIFSPQKMVHSCSKSYTQGVPLHDWNEFLLLSNMN